MNVLIPYRYMEHLRPQRLLPVSWTLWLLSACAFDWMSTSPSGAVPRGYKTGILLAYSDAEQRVTLRGDAWRIWTSVWSKIVRTVMQCNLVMRYYVCQKHDGATVDVQRKEKMR